MRGKKEGGWKEERKGEKKEEREKKIGVAERKREGEPKSGC